MLKQGGYIGLALALLVTLGVVLGVALAPQPERGTPKAAELPPAEATQALLRRYILDNPEVVVQALQSYEQRQQALQADRLRATLVAEAAALNDDPDAPVIGNPEGDITVVEFFDYRCPYCKRATATLAQLLQEDSDLRLVMKEFPILSQESVQAARAALAAVRQDRYEAFHFALMENGGGFTDEEILAVAEAVGLDAARLLADMQDPAIEAALRRNHALAERIGITGTPAFIIGDTLVPGAISIEELRARIAEARAKAG
ncbi:MAG: DsbA family protein [Kiloniellaceae bacterium]